MKTNCRDRRKRIYQGFISETTINIACNKLIDRIYNLPGSLWQWNGIELLAEHGTCFNRQRYLCIFKLSRLSTYRTIYFLYYRDPLWILFILTLQYMTP